MRDFFLCLVEHQLVFWPRPRPFRHRSLSQLVETRFIEGGRVYLELVRTYPPKNGIFEDDFPFRRWDMLIPWRVRFSLLYHGLIWLGKTFKMISNQSKYDLVRQVGWVACPNSSKWEVLPSGGFLLLWTASRCKPIRKRKCKKPTLHVFVFLASPFGQNNYGKLLST